MPRTSGSNRTCSYRNALEHTHRISANVPTPHPQSSQRWSQNRTKMSLLLLLDCSTFGNMFADQRTWSTCISLCKWVLCFDLQLLSDFMAAWRLLLEHNRNLTSSVGLCTTTAKQCKWWKPAGKWDKRVSWIFVHTLTQLCPPFAHPPVLDIPFADGLTASYMSWQMHSWLCTCMSVYVLRVLPGMISGVLHLGGALPMGPLADFPILPRIKVGAHSHTQRHTHLVIYPLRLLTV